ncbi:MAG: 16S rRNA (adenine(1518)-N(6)/adenine(1519)-N(6))-dimethyltransferase RsmA [Bryobacteraceae bacterium]|nr:16S rRNA (adenine(1518)-N(6)/adenine(1519)-N(6))-dimethyltransferase RsmA [Bryobacteraceae bacterium]
MGQRFGQHFLIREATLERIARAACPEPEPTVIEIGPGRGELTAHLLARAGRLVAVEVDPELIDPLRRLFATEAKFELVQADVLATDLAQWGPVVVVGNLPYYITSPIIEKVLALGSLLKRAVFLVQREVAERLVAKPGSRDYGYLSVRTQYLAEAELLFPVPPKAFRPPPKVDSAVVRLTMRPGVTADEEFLRFAGVCFRQKRKTLRNNLAAVYGALTAGELPEGGLRAEQIPVASLVKLHQRLKGR